VAQCVTSVPMVPYPSPGVFSAYDDLKVECPVTLNR
jgi:hypothetical protein